MATIIRQSRRFGAKTVWLLIGLAVGCHTPATQRPDGTPVVLPPARTSDSNVTLDIGFFRISQDESVDDQLWANVDEQAIDAEIRRLLLADGFRCGVIESRMPAEIESVLVAAADGDRNRFRQLQDVSAAMEGASSPDKLSEQNRRLYLRPGKHAEIVTSPTCDALTLLRRGDHDVVGTTYQQAQTVFSLTANNTAVGGVLVMLTPELQYGKTKSRFVGTDGAMRLDFTRERQIFRELAIRVNLTAGQTLLVTGTGEPLTVGGNFFHCVEEGTRLRKLLLVRLNRPGRETLFEEPQGKLAIDEL